MEEKKKKNGRIEWIFNGIKEEEKWKN